MSKYDIGVTTLEKGDFLRRYIEFRVKFWQNLPKESTSSTNKNEDKIHFLLVRFNFNAKM